MEDDKEVMQVSTPSPPLQVAGGLALSDSVKSEALTESLEAQFQPVNDPSDSAVIEMVNETKRAYEYAPANEPKLSSSSKVLQAIKGLKFGKAPGPNSIPNRVLIHLPKCAITCLTSVFNSVLLRQKLPPALKQARVKSILRPGTDDNNPVSVSISRIIVYKAAFIPAVRFVRWNVLN
jgi:hypothetical protein